MTKPNPPQSPARASPGSEAEQARAAHDQGRYRDKIPGSDPAAAPLGTDSEAAGMGNPEGAVGPPPSGGVVAAGTHPAGHARGDVPDGLSRWVWIVAAGAVALLLGLMVGVTTVGSV